MKKEMRTISVVEEDRGAAVVGLLRPGILSVCSSCIENNFDLVYRSKKTYL